MRPHNSQFLFIPYLPETDNFLINTDSADTPEGETVTSLPISTISWNTSNKLPETVIRSNGLPFLPFSIMKPVDCNEKLPLCGFSPACNPWTSVI